MIYYWPKWFSLLLRFSIGCASEGGCGCVGLTTWYPFPVMPAALSAFPRGLSQVCVACARVTCGWGSYLCEVLRPGAMAGLQGVSWGPGVPGPFARSCDRSISGGSMASPCFQNRSEGGERTHADFSAVFSAHRLPPCVMGKSSQEAAFALQEPVSHTKELCLKINSLDFGLCWGFPALFFFLKSLNSFFKRNLHLTPNI